MGRGKGSTCMACVRLTKYKRLALVVSENR